MTKKDNSFRSISSGSLDKELAPPNGLIYQRQIIDGRSPTIVDFTKATHDHSADSEGGVLNGIDAIAEASIPSTLIDFGGAGAGIWWEEIARTTLTEAGDTITVSSIPTRKYLMFLMEGLASGGTIDSSFKFNNDGSALYRMTYQVMSAPGTATDTGAVTAVPIESTTTTSGALTFSRLEVVNRQSYAKIFHLHNTNNTSAGAMTWLDGDGRWVNTTDYINRIDWTNAGTGNFGVGSEVIVLGRN